MWEVYRILISEHVNIYLLELEDVKYNNFHFQNIIYIFGDNLLYLCT